MKISFLLIILIVSCAYVVESLEDNMEVNRQWNVKLNSGTNADEVAKSLGFENKGNIFGDWYTFEHKQEHYASRSTEDHAQVKKQAESSLKSHPNIENAEENVKHVMQKKPMRF